ncbi:MAG: hypothetical protein JSW05_06160 [Candidatus Thorarchaeota archaeon]|nr:MAG: hypothetical protein JSW05_06160 [Candidatus Thorarchaeota archaeon]
MRSRLFGIMALLTMLSLSTVSLPVQAQSNHSLQWGVELGQEMTYALQRKMLDPSYSSFFADYAPFLTEMNEGQRLIARVTHLDPIPSIINESSQMPSSNCTLIRMNDSEVIMENMFMIAVPIGDWDFTSEMSNFSFFEEATIVDTQDEWGTVIDATFLMALFPITMHMEMIYEKANGTMKIMQMLVNFAGSDIIDVVFAQWYPGMPLVLPRGWQPPFLLTVTLVGVAGVVIIFFGRRWYKRRKLIVENQGG